MKSFVRHKYLSLFLGCIFCLFNIGIPIVILSCPMMKTDPKNASCCYLIRHQEPGTARIESSRTCCRSSRTINRNTNEFLGASSPSRIDVKFTCCSNILFQILTAQIPNPTIRSDASFILFTHTRSESPGDFPVLYSSLLI